VTAPKRIFDVVASGLGLMALAPLFGLAALLIKLRDRGPVFYRQTRIGRAGRPFRIWKFRTMVPDADRSGVLITVGRDSRITPIGRWLRKFKIDELPQLINVFVGEMSFVGPRPEVEKYVSLYTEEQRRVLAYVPGITDPASLKYYNESELLEQSEDSDRMYVEEIMPDKTAINLEYAQRSTVWSDLRLVVGTVLRCLR